MKTVIQMRWPGITKETYETLLQLMDWEANIPDGVIVHAAGFNDAGICVTDIWESAEKFQTFLQNRLMPAIVSQGITGEPQNEMYPLHRLHTPEESIIA